MRIISGTHKGAIIHAPKNLPVRPTTDRAKESLFNILSNYYNFEELSVLDLFCGTGNITFEFASRGAIAVLAVDSFKGCVNFVNETANKLSLPAVEAIKADAFSYLKNCTETFDIVFADAPYAMSEIIKLPDLVFNGNLLKNNGVLIVEHTSKLLLNNHHNFAESRVYGQSTFSFFKHKTS